MAGLTEQLAAFCSAPDFPPLSDRVVSIVQTGFADTIATMIAGRDEPVTAIARQFVAARQSGLAESTLLLGPQRAASADAALVNACAGHALDFDDVALGGHPSTVLVPAVLAEAQRLNASGAQALRAYLVGYEVWAELFVRETGAYHLKGWHPTGVLGTLGAAAAVAYLNGLNPTQARNALALAASMASGLVANFGTMTKPLHAGRAAANGIEAVRYAQLGLTAAPDALEHHAGYLAALSPSGDADRSAAAAPLGRNLRILDFGLSIKKYPMCYATHRVIDGVLDLARAHQIQGSDVREVQATIGVAQASMLRNHSPVTGLEAKFSLEFAVACALVAGKVGLSELTDDFVGRADIRGLMPRVSLVTVQNQCPVEPVFSKHDRVALILQDGTCLDSGEIRFARGNALAPLAGDELRTKFLDCVASADWLDGAQLYQRLTHLDAVASMAALT